MALYSLVTDHHLGKQISVGTGEFKQHLIHSNSGIIKPFHLTSPSAFQNSENAFFLKKAINTVIAVNNYNIRNKK